MSINASVYRRNIIYDVYIYYYAFAIHPKYDFLAPSANLRYSHCSLPFDTRNVALFCYDLGLEASTTHIQHS